MAGIGPATTNPTYIARLTVVIAAAALSLLGLSPGGLELARAGDDPARVVQLTNAERVGRGLPPYAVAGDLAAVAQRHAERMAAEGRIYHNPDLGSEVGGWWKLAENVGFEQSVDGVHRLFMESAGHRVNILAPDLTEIGTGVATNGAYVYVVQVFRLPDSAPPEPEPAPEPEPEPEPETALEPQPEPEPQPEAAPEPVAETVPPPPETVPVVPTTLPALEPTLAVVGMVERAAAVPLRTTPAAVSLPVLPVESGPPAAAVAAAFLLAAVVAAQGLAVRRLKLA
jgi:uncharacterized protein YkwD